MTKYPVYEAIRQLLLADWDPIPGSPSDEYDQYAMGIWSRVEKGASVEEIATYLRWAAEENIGMTGGDPVKLRNLERQIALKAVALKKKGGPVAGAAS